MNNNNDTYRSLFNDDILLNQFIDLSNNITLKFNQIDGSFNIVDTSYNYLNNRIVITDTSLNDLSNNLYNNYYDKNYINDLSNNIQDHFDIIDISYNYLKNRIDLTDMSLNDLSNNLYNNYYDKNYINDLSNNIQDYFNIIDLKIIDVSNNIITYTDDNFYKKSFYDTSYNYLLNEIIDLSNNIQDHFDIIDISYNYLKNRIDLTDISLNDLSNNLYNNYYDKNYINDLSDNIQDYFNIIDLKIIDVSNNIITYTDDNFYKKSFYDTSYNYLLNEIIDVSNNIITYTNDNYYNKSFYDLSYNYLLNEIIDTSNNTYSRNFLDNSNNLILTKFNDYYTSSQIQNLYYNKTYIDNLVALYYTKIQVDNILLNYITSSSLSNILSNYYLKSEINNILSTNLNNYVNNYTLSPNKITGMGGNGTLFLSNDGTFKDVGSVSGYVTLSFLENNYYDLTEMNNLYYTKQYINDNYYNVISIQQLLNNYALINNVYDKSYINTNYKNNTELSSILLNYALINNVYDKSYIDNILNNYLLTSTFNNTISNYYDKNYINTNIYLKSQTYSQTEINNLLSNYVLNSYLNNYYTSQQVDNLLGNYYTKLQIDFNIYNKSQVNNILNDYYLKNQTYSQTEINNLLNNYLLTSTFNNTISNYYDKNYINIFFNPDSYYLRLTTLQPASTDGTYVLQTIRSGNGSLNQFSWVNPSNLAFSPYQDFITSSSGSYMNLKQLFNPFQSYPVSIEYICSNSYNNDYTTSIGLNSSGIYGGSSLGAPYSYIYSGLSNIRFFCKNQSNNIDTGLLISNSLIRLWRNLDLNYYQILNSGNIRINNGGLYTNQIYTDSGNTITINNNISCNQINTNNNTISCGGINMNNGTLSNYELEYREMNKYTSGFISNKLINLYTYSSWAITSSEDNKGGGIGMYRGANFNDDLVYLSANRTFTINNDFKVYLKIPYSSNNQHFIYTQNGDLDLSVDTGGTANTSGILKTNNISVCNNSNNYNISVVGNFNMNNWEIKQLNKIYVNEIYSYNSGRPQMRNGAIFFDHLNMNNYIIDQVGSLYVNNIYNYSNNLNMNTVLNMNGYNIINCPSLGGGGSLTNSDSIAVNTGGYNYLRKTNITLSGVQIFGVSSNAFNLENKMGEASGVAIDGDYDGITLYTPIDSGSLVNFQDEDSSNSRVAYINSAGSYIQVSTNNIKYSLRKKNKENYDYLNRLMKLNIYSYCYKYKINENDDEKKKIRKYMKNKQYHIGLIMEEVNEVFKNCIPKYNKFELDDNNKDDFYNLTNGYKPDIDEDKYINNKNNNLSYNGINQTALLSYTIMSIQDLNKKLEDENKLLKNKYNDLENKFNILLEKLNISI